MIHNALSERLVQVKSSAQLEEDLPTYTPYDIVFLFGYVIRPVGLILNHNEPTEYFVLFPPPAPMQEIFNLGENPSWVGAHMQLVLHRTLADIFHIVTKLLQDKALEEGRSMNIFPLNLWIPEVLGSILLPKEGGPAAPALAEQLKSMTTQELQQIMSALQQDMKSRQDASLGSTHEVFAVLQTLLKEGALRTNIPKLSAFSGEMTRGCHLNSGAMSSKPSESPTVTQH